MRSATALRVLNAALLVGLGASLAMVAPGIRARLLPRQAAVTTTPAGPPRPAPIETPQRVELSLEPPVRGGDTVWRVIANNRGVLENCYRRALSRDDSVGRGKVTIKLAIGTSGQVAHVGIDAPPRLRAMDQCLRLSLSRWPFPHASKRYAVEFTFQAS